LISAVISANFALSPQETESNKPVAFGALGQSKLLYQTPTPLQLTQIHPPFKAFAMEASEDAA